MTTFTRSGLVPSHQKFVPRFKKTVDINSLLPCAITRPAPFSLKPYADLYNPYSSRGCSVLCNHPRSKNSWVCFVIHLTFRLKNSHEIFPFRTAMENRARLNTRNRKIPTSLNTFKKNFFVDTQPTPILDRSLQRQAVLQVPELELES